MKRFIYRRINRSSKTRTREESTISRETKAGTSFVTSATCKVIRRSGPADETGVCMCVCV